MQHADYFNAFLKDTVNLSQFKLDTLSNRVDTIYAALKVDPELGPLIVKKIPQGSWAQRTIINPQKGKEFDADFMLQLSENPDWSDNVKEYRNAIYRALENNSTYADMPHEKKCRCIRLVYANSMHVDIVPFLILDGGRQVIVNADDNEWETTDPAGFTAWMREKDGIANGNLRKVIRILKYLRDHKNSFTGTRSIILTTVLGKQVDQFNKIVDPGYYSNVPTTLLNLVKDLDEWLQANWIKPPIPDPSGSGVTFDHRWTEATYSYFRDRIHTHASEIEDAFHETDPDRSVAKWQRLFGDGFKAPATSTNGSKFPATGVGAAGAGAATSTSRSGRAG
jgi:hypothetical protein